MASEQSSNVKLEIGHVLFIDIVGYSKLLINEQSDQIQRLKEIVRGTEQVRVAEAENKLLRLPTGDGGALVFRNDPEAPVVCALEISKELKKHPELRVRMGIHSGPVNEVVDLNEQSNIAGAGINIAQRVMDCGDAGHILLSKRVTDDLEHYPQWRSHLHDLGEVEVKHRVRVHLFNLYNEELGNPELPEKVRQAKGSGAVRVDEGFWVAVLPFKYSGSNSDLTALAEGITEEIVTGLSRFSYLKVISRSSTSRYANESVDVRSAGKELGARYVMEGSLRQAGTKLRLAVQLVDTVSGAHLWAENYERSFNPETIFELQDDLVPRIVSTIADMNGVLPRSMSETLRSRTPEQLSPYEAVLRSFGYFERVTPEELAIARSGLELAVQNAPGYVDAWAMLADLRVQDYAQGFNLQADSLTSGLSAARRAVEAGPSNHLAYFSLTQALFFKKEFQSFRNAAERAVGLNPMDGNSIAFVGELLTYAGDSERGLELAARAKQLNPNHPGWYWYADFYNAYRQGDYRDALNFLLKADLPGHWGMHAGMAACYAQLGEGDAAGKGLRALLKLRPDIADTIRTDVEKWWEPDYGKHFIDGLRKAGLQIPPETEAALPGLDTSRSSAKSNSDAAARREERFWVAVLPFKYSGSNADLTALAEGITEEIVTGLSRFSYLKVVSRSSTARYANESVDVRSAGKELGARYVMEGSLRQTGAKLRLAVQLIDAKTGAHLWAENYERAFSPEAVFELQDDLVPRIVSTVADMHGVLPRSMSEVVRLKGTAQLTPYEALLHSFGYNERFTPDALAEARDCLEKAVEQAPENADCWAMLSLIYSNEYGHWDIQNPDSFEKALRAARKAVMTAPLHSLPHYALAQALFFRREFPAARTAAERAVSLNPMDGATAAFMGLLIAYSGDWERGCALAEKGLQLNPNLPGMYNYTAWHYAYGKKDYRAALDIALKLNTPDSFYQHAVLAMCYAQLGETDAARKSLQEMLALKPDYGKVARQLHGKWIQPDLVEQLMDGLRKAGLEIGDTAGVSADVNASNSGTVRAGEGFWVAVLPFKYSGSNPDLTALADGLTEEIVTGLSRFSYLKVIARGSTSRYANESVDVRSAGKELGARYVMEGSFRQSAAKLRLAVQLVDRKTGAHLWAENYERGFSPETIFELQDDLAPRIVSTVADQYGALVHSMSESLRGRKAGEYSPHEAVLRAFGYWERMTPAEHAEVRDILEAAVAIAPGHSDCFAELAMIYWHEYAFGYNLKPDSLGRARAAAQRAVASAPTSHFAHCALATTLFFQKDYPAFRAAAERALALNRMDSSTAAILGNMIAYAGDWEYGLGIVERAMQLNPHHAGWYHYVAFCDAYRRHDYRGALASALKVNMPAYHWPYVYLAAVYGQLGEQDRARAALREVHALLPNFGAMAREEMGKWLDAELTEHLVDGLRKAGLEIASK